MITTRAATADDVETWRALRLHGIQRFPAAFRLSEADHDATSVTADAAQLAKGGRFLAFAEDRAVGSIGLFQHTQSGTTHRGEIFGMYVIPEMHGTDVATSLMQAVFDHARHTGVWQLELTVNEANPRAVAFYERLGFTKTGRIPNAIMAADGPEHDLTYALTNATPPQSS